ncbi:MAG: hypothetical protein E4H40_03290 [Candidatus Brocadiia bacterium]|nr:MAG: hypothetical protein E4H40_03290 [Candidatus Brocadiia bacterium]
MNLLLTDPVAKPNPLQNLKNITNDDEQKKIKFAKDFESVFVNKLLDEMRKTVGEWGLEKDGTSKQIDGLFSMFLAQDISKNGGMGLWKEIYKSLADQDQAAPDSLDDKL